MSIDSYKHLAIDDIESIWGGFQVRARAALGVESFGLGITQVPPNFDQMPPHTHTHDGQEEVYIPLAGSGELVFGDGTRVALDQDVAVRVGPTVSRRIVAGEDGLQLLIAGGTPEQSYEAMPHSELGADQPNPAELPGVVAAAGGEGTDSDDYSSLRLTEMSEGVAGKEFLTFHMVGRMLETSAFGLAILEIEDAGERIPYPMHNHEGDGQTEVYAIQRGGGTMLVGGDTIELAAGDLVAVAPATDRQIKAGPEGIRVIAIGA